MSGNKSEDYGCLDTMQHTDHALKSRIYFVTIPPDVAVSAIINAPTLVNNVHFSQSDPRRVSQDLRLTQNVVYIN